MIQKRKHTKAVRIGGVTVGGEHPVAIQSMTNTDTGDIQATVAQIHALTAAGCEIIRVAVRDTRAAEAIPKIKNQIDIPLVCDIHFDYRLALLSLQHGADKLRINPGNIGGEDKVGLIAAEAKARGAAIRVGVNTGSIDQKVLAEYGGKKAEAAVASALQYIRMLESFDFYDIVCTVKSSDPPTAVAAYTMLSEQTDYPLHIGVTEAGSVYSGSVKSAVGLGALLLNGIGDTIRVSLTGDPLEEVRCAKEILSAAGLRKFGAEIISCPTCGRTRVGLLELAARIERETRHIKKHIKVAVMGCEVNGPGEAKDADYGIACGKGVGLLFARGKIIGKFPEERLADELLRVIGEEI